MSQIKVLILESLERTRKINELHERLEQTKKEHRAIQEALAKEITDHHGTSRQKFKFKLKHAGDEFIVTVGSLGRLEETEPVIEI